MNSITNPFFSVIMPIYKVEPYLSKCIDSVLAQSFANFELILVDDGSPDSCPQICDAYAALDSRISVIHKPNGGLADARNIGLTVMAGSLAKKNDDGYVIFIDSDDYFCNNNTFQQIYNRIQSFKEEVVLYGCKIVQENESEEITRGNYPIDVLNYHDKAKSLDALFLSNNFPGSAWIYSVKRSLIRDNYLRFTKGVTAEDFEWIISCLVLCNAIGAIDGVHYAYVKRNGSITTKSRITAYWGLRAALDRYYSYDKRYAALDAFMARVYLLAVMSYNGLTKVNKVEASKILKTYLYILSEAGQKKYYYFVKLLGFKFSSLAVRLAYNKVR